MEHQRDTLGLWALTLGLSLALATPVTSETYAWCYTVEQSATWSCPDPDVMRVEAVQLGAQSLCSGGECCPLSVYCVRPAENYNADLFTLITGQCEGETACNITYNRPSILQIDCSMGGVPDNHQVDYVNVYYTCEDRHEATSLQAFPAPEPSAHYTKTPTPTLTSPTQSTSDGHTTGAPTSGAESVAPSVAGDPLAVDGKVNTDVLIGVTVTVACLILLTIVLVVVCVRRRKCRQKPAPSTRSTGHRNTAANNVYTVNENSEKAQLATFHPQLPASDTPTPDPEVSAPGPGTSVREPESPHREPGTTPEVVDGGASGGDESYPGEDDDLSMNENEVYGQTPAGSTGHRDTAANNVYTVNDNNEIARLATFHPELPARRTPNPDPEVSASGPDTEVRDPETPHREPDTAPESLDGGASGGEESYLDEDDDLSMNENEAYGQIP